MMNRAVLVGRLTADPQLRYTPNGVPVATFTLAVNRNFKTNGEQEADFISCVIWRKSAENVATFLKKGSLAGVDGRIQTRNYENNEGKKVYVTEIQAENVQFLEPKNNGQGEKQKSNTNTGGNNYNRNSGQQKSNSNYTRVDDDPFANDGKAIDISDDDLPF